MIVILSIANGSLHVMRFFAALRMTKNYLMTKNYKRAAIIPKLSELIATRPKFPTFWFFFSSWRLAVSYWQSPFTTHYSLSNISKRFINISFCCFNKSIISCCSSFCPASSCTALTNGTTNSA